MKLCPPAATQVPPEHLPKHLTQTGRRLAELGFYGDPLDCPSSTAPAYLYPPKDISLACCNTAPSKAPTRKRAQKEEKDMSKMDIAIRNTDASSDEMQQRKFLERRLYEVQNEKREALRQRFYMDDMEDPKTPAEFRERLAKGLFTVRTNKNSNGEETLYYGYDSQLNLRWRDPTKPSDRDGYDRAIVVLTSAFDTSMDDIKILSPSEGLKALREFGKWTFTPAN